MNIYATLFYTSKDKDYKKNLYSFLNNYKNIGIKDVFLYTDECLPTEFEWLYKDFFQKHRRGYGYWAWKPLIIYDSMKKINDGDFILYHDVGRSCYNFDIHYNILPLAKDIKENYDGIGVAHGPFSHKEFSKRDAFYYMGCDEQSCWNLVQVSATWSLWEKKELPKKILMDWIKWCFHEKEIITDLPNKCGLPNFPEFKDNRHDQTILTNLIYLYGKNNPKIKPITPNGWEKPMNSCLKKYYPKDPKSVLFVIKSCEKYESRVDVILNTWLKNNKDYIVCSDHENKQKNIIKVTDKKEYAELEDKSLAIYNYLKNDYGIKTKYKWIMVIDDDTYVNIKNLKEVIKELDDNNAYGYISDCFKDQKNTLCENKNLDKSTRWFDGGAGLLFGTRCLNRLNLNKKNVYFEDLAISLNFQESNINLIHNRLFNWHGNFKQDIEKAKKQITYHHKQQASNIKQFMETLVKINL